jgi:histidyl-tRNA synthetase
VQEEDTIVLSKKLGGRATPAVGVSLGLDRLILACKDKFVLPSTKKIAVIALEQGFLKKSIFVSEKIRSSFPNIQIRNSGLDNNLKSQLKKADKNNFNFAIILGREEVESNSYTLKDLDSGKNHEKLSLDELISFLK